jgi:hypothetical protein
MDIYRETAVWIYTYRGNVNAKKEKLITVSLLLFIISCLNEKFIAQK